MLTLLTWWVLRKIRWGGRITRPWPGYFSDMLKYTYLPNIVANIYEQPSILNRPKG